MPEVPTSLPSIGTILTWLAAGGSVLVISWATSWGLEGWSLWAKLQPRTKSLIILVLAVVLGVGASIIVQSPPALAFCGKYAPPVIGSVVVWLGMQYAHGKDPKRVKYDIVK